MPAGPGVRIDTAIEPGDRVPPEYDNLVAKLMVHAADRDAAIARLGRALDELEVGGIQTTAPFHQFVVTDEAFRAGRLSTGFVAERWDGGVGHARAVRAAQLAAGLDALEPSSTARLDGGHRPIRGGARRPRRPRPAAIPRVHLAPRGAIGRAVEVAA